jgi:hypothetical protein
MVGIKGEKGVPQSASLIFNDINVGSFDREINVRPDLLHWSSCSDTLMIHFDSSVMLESKYAGRSISIDKQEVFFSFKQCE